MINAGYYKIIGNHVHSKCMIEQLVLMKEYNKFIDIVLDSIFQFVFEKVPLLQFGYMEIYKILSL